jgi:hypothetical protein
MRRRLCCRFGGFGFLFEQSLERVFRFIEAIVDAAVDIVIGMVAGVLLGHRFGVGDLSAEKQAGCAAEEEKE